MSYRQPLRAWPAPRAVTDLGLGKGGGGHRGGGHHGGGRFRGGRRGWGYPRVWGWGPGYWGYGYYYDTRPTCEDVCFGKTPSAYAACMDGCASRTWY